MTSNEIVKVAEPTPGQLAGLLVEHGNFDVDKLAKLMELQKEYEANKARQAYAEALVQFRSRCPTIKRTGKAKIEGRGSSFGYTYAQLPQAIEQIQSLMDQCGLAVNWTTPTQQPTWIEVRCTLTHVLGHCESTTLGGPPDTSGAKNQLQAIGSTHTYLKRITLFGLLGLVDKDEVDDDGQGGATMQEKLPKSDEARKPNDIKGKELFRQACLDKTAQKELPSGVLWRALAQAQKLSGLQDAAECAAWLRTQKVSVIGGEVYLELEIDTRPPEPEDELPGRILGTGTGLSGDAANKFIEAIKNRRAQDGKAGVV